MQLFQHVEPGFNVARIAIKIPSTWEGMMACHTLELAGVRTLATTLFSMPQAVLAAEVGCTYVAPYVNELKVNFTPGSVTSLSILKKTSYDTEDDIRFVDRENLTPLCVDIQQYYWSIKAPTKVLPASLTSIDQIFVLAGVDHLSIAPHLLAQLTQPVRANVPSLFDSAPNEPVHLPGTSYLHDHGRYQITFARDKGGASQRKLTEV